MSTRDQQHEERPTSHTSKRRKTEHSQTSTNTTLEPLAYNEYTVGWVCALPKEQTAATAMLDQRHSDLPKPPSDPNTYTLGSIGKHNVVIACLPKGKIGTNAAATVATRMISTFPSIKFGLMVGIGGGVPPKVRLGDVVVSIPVDQFPGVVQWDFGKAKDGGIFERIGSLNNPPSALLTAVAKLETEHEFNGSKIAKYLKELQSNWPKLAPKYLKSDLLEDILFKADYDHVSKSSTDCDISPDDGDGDEDEESCQYCDRANVVKRKSREMRVHYGLIASGNQVIKDAIFRDKLNKYLGGSVLCFEMEAAGLMDNFPCIVIRGICDYADSHKNKYWQEHAAAVAAGLAKELLEFLQPSDVEGERAAKNIFSELLAEMKAEVHKEEDTEILNWLTPIDYAPQQHDFISRRQEGTGQWLLDSAKFQAWLNTDIRTLFCPGIPGAGKTILTSVVVEELVKRFYNNNRVGIAYLYCNFKRQDEQTAQNLLANLLKQLTQGRSSLPDRVKFLYNSHKKKRTRPSFNEILRTLQSVAAIYSKVFVIVDALDECQTTNGCRASFLSEIFNLQVKSKVCLFATSRFIPEITERFHEAISLEIRADEHDIRRYIDSYILYLPSFVQRSPDLQEEIKTEISNAVDGMFLLAQLYLDTLEDKLTSKDMKIALKRFRKQHLDLDKDEKIEILAQTYDQAMERIQGQKKGFRQLAEKVLPWITYAKRPLTVWELQHALAIEAGDDELDKDNIPDIEDMVSVCAGLVTIDEETRIIRLVHYTTQEYFERTKARWFWYTDTEITIICTTYLLFDVFKSGFCATDEEFEKRLQINQLYDYAARNWGYHARSASTAAEELILSLLKSEAKLSACAQAMLALKQSYSNYSQRVPKNITGVHVAVYFGLKEAIIFLLKNTNDLDTQDTDSRTPLSWAAESGHETVAQLLLDRDAEVDSRDDDGQTPLSWAARSGHETVVQLLLDRGAEVDSRDDDGQTPLSWATRSRHETVVQLLLDRGAEVDSRDRYSQTPLSWAARSRYETVAQLLLDRGAEIDSRDDDGQTPLSWAARSGHETVVQLLLDRGAEVDSRDRYSQTPLSWAARSRHETVAQLLLDRGAEVDSRDRYSQTPLSWAARSGHETVAQLLLDRGAEVDSRDDDDQTPLSWAARSGHETVVQLLLDRGAEVDSRDDDDQTPLSWAARSGHETVVQLLLDRGAEIDSRDDDGQTSLSWAARSRHEAVVQLLKLYSTPSL